MEIDREVVFSYTTPPDATPIHGVMANQVKVVVCTRSQGFDLQACPGRAAVDQTGPLLDLHQLAPLMMQTRSTTSAAAKFTCAAHHRLDENGYLDRLQDRALAG